MKHRRNVAFERDSKKQAAHRDQYCRFPLCGCQRPGCDWLKRLLTVSHDFHKGIGGESAEIAEKVSIADLMLLLCTWRHKDAPVSRDKKTMRTIYLTPDHNDGPLAWEIKLRALYPDGPYDDSWFEIARETYVEGSTGSGRHTLRLEPLSSAQRQVLEDLATMER